MIGEFDKDKNGRLDNQERAAALADLKANPGQQRGRRRGPPGGFGGGAVATKPGRKVERDGVESFVGKPLYDPAIFRTVFIDFEGDTWEKEMGTLKNYGVDVSANVTVDGKTYKEVGLRFRGNSSFFSVQEGQKRSLNLSFDWAKKDQDLYGYRTLNLLNSHSDASFLRLALYSKIASNYIPVPKVNYVHVVINGESWGVYVNEQQFNKDFTQEFFGETGGRRWKSPPGGQGGASFAYNGEDKSAYAAYEWKSKETDGAWADLIGATKTIADVSKEEIESKVDEVLSIDRVLWFLAVDNVLLDMDGYYKRGADYVIYQEPKFNRFHILPYDNNETFRAEGGGPGFGGGGPGGGGRRGGGRGGRRGGPPGGGPPGGGPPPEGGILGGRLGGGTASFELDIYAGIEEKRAPFINKLLQNPAVKARYVAHLRTVRDQWMDWNKVSPMINEYRKLIGDEIKKDTRKLTTTKAYDEGIGMGKTQGRGSSPGLKAFFEGRKTYLDKAKDLNAPYPEIATTEIVFKDSENNLAVKIEATLKDKKVKGDVSVYAYYATDRLAKYTKVAMETNGKMFQATLPEMPRGTTIFYYLEARSEVGENIACSFAPHFAEGNPASTLIPLNRGSSSKVLINEVMATNKATIADADGEYGDWIELTSTKDVDLSNMYLTDDQADAKKWKFPEGTKIAANEMLIVWADGTSLKKSKSKKGVHANFKLSKFGETVSLFAIGKDNKPVLVDSLTYESAHTDRSVGRNAAGKVLGQTPTPGKKNSLEY